MPKSEVVREAILEFHRIGRLGEPTALLRVFDDLVPKIPPRDESARSTTSFRQSAKLVSNSPVLVSSYLKSSYDPLGSEPLPNHTVAIIPQ